MRYIDNNSTDAYFNLACEEYLLKHTEEEYFMLWINEPCIVIGKNQNTLTEINQEFADQHNIKVVRRLTGGGAVFHDLGNLNFTFIVNDKNSFNDYRRFTAPVIEVLKKLDISAEFSGRNDMLIDGLKFSGNAQCRHMNRIMHHGTLLFSSSITDLSCALNPKPEKLLSRGIKSVASRVTNISSHLSENLSVTEFKDMIFRHISSEDESLSSLTTDEINNIQKLRDEKYSTWAWNYGKSPLYSICKTARTNGGIIESHLDIKSGYIEKIKIYGDFFGISDIKEVENFLTGKKYDRVELTGIISDDYIGSYIANTTAKEFIDALIS